MNTRDAIDTAARLEAMGVEVRSAELREEVDTWRTFAERGGNRALRRASERARRRKGRGWTR